MQGRGGKFLERLLACPACKGRLDFFADSISCAACGLQFPQGQGSYLDLLPPHGLHNEGTNWGERQKEMEQYYKDLISTPERASSWLAYDYEPFAVMLATFTGTVLDIGGGAGIPRHYLPPDAQYIALDPSTDWLGAEWALIASRFPCLQTSPHFIRGVGEYLPLSAESLDAAIAFWSLNHASRPERIFSEVWRALKPGGRFLAVLEDMEPGWSDLFDRSFLGLGRRAGRAFAKKLRASLPGRRWPVQSDHIYIRESDLRSWSAPYFAVSNRTWVGQFLTYEFSKKAPAARAVPAGPPALIH